MSSNDELMLNIAKYLKEMAENKTILHEKTTISTRKRGDPYLTKKGKVDKRCSSELSEERKIKLRDNISKARIAAKLIWAKDGHKSCKKEKEEEKVEETEYEYEIKPRPSKAESKNERILEQEVEEKPRPKARKKYVKRLVTIDVTDTEPETPRDRIIQNPYLDDVKPLPTKSYVATTHLRNKLIGKIIN